MIICADDYGISQSVSNGIIELIDGGRISATSCMVTGSEGLQQQMAAVADRRHTVDIGLHLTLTDDRPITDLRPEQGLTEANGRFLSFSKLLSNCYRGRVDSASLEREISAQLSRFVGLAGFQPDFIDGHQHAHQLPVVRDVLLRVCAEILRGDFFVRCGTFPAKWLLSKSLPTRLKIGSQLIGLPAIGFKRAIQRHDIQHNGNLIGHYNSPERMAFNDIFTCYLSLGPELNDIFYVHPGYIDDELRSKDTFVEERISELEYLRSVQFLDQLESSGQRVNRFQFP